MFLGYPTRVQVFIIFGLSHVPGISNKGGFESSHKSLSTKERGKSNVRNIALLL